MVKKSDIDWKAYLKPEEAEEIRRLETQDEGSRQRRRQIYLRCRKRAEKALKMKEPAQ